MSIFNIFKSLFGETIEKTKFKVNAKIETSVHYNNDINPVYKKKLSNGLLPGEIILINWLDGKSTSSNPPGYFEYTYGLKTGQSTEKLINNGYLRQASPFESLPSLKVPELKELLKTKSLKVSGNKAALIERIIENFSLDEVDKYVKDKSLVITGKGHEVLKEYYYIVPAHRNDSKDGIYNVANAISFVNNFKGTYNPPNGDISWALFQKAFLKHSEELNYGLMSIDLSNMAKQLRKENKYSHAIFNYFRVFIIELSGLSNGKGVSHPNIMTYGTSTGLEILKLKEVLNLSQEQLKEEFFRAWDKTFQGLLFHYLTKEECFQCLLAALDEEEDYIKEVLYNAYEDLKRNVDEETFEKKIGLFFPIDYKDKLY